jgi:hypothetical protein
VSPSSQPETATPTSFQWLTRGDGRCARARFGGRFEGREVIWDAALKALGRASGQRQFIHIGAPGPQGRRLSLGLAVDRIDAATVRKAAIMMRNYRRLRPGRHEWSGPLPSSKQ